jgi:hypothetical protein
MKWQRKKSLEIEGQGRIDDTGGRRTYDASRLTKPGVRAQTHKMTPHVFRTVMTSYY